MFFLLRHALTLPSLQGILSYPSGTLLKIFNLSVVIRSIVRTQEVVSLVLSSDAETEGVEETKLSAVHPQDTHWNVLLETDVLTEVAAFLPVKAT